MRAFRSLGTGVALTLAVAATPALAQSQKPNVVFILADNVGYGDLGSYGGGELRGAPTPRLDELAIVRDCGLPNFWSSQPALPRERRS
jgi:hypothetical protein